MTGTKRSRGTARHSKGCKLLEVLSVKLLPSDEMKRNYDEAKEIYGTIQVSSHDNNGNCTSSLIFHRSHVLPQFVQPHGFLTLTGPNENAIVAESAVYVRFNLFDKKKNGPSEEEVNSLETDQVDKMGDLLFNVSEDPSGVDQILCKKFQTNCGVLELTFVPYNRALQVSVQVSLISWTERTMPSLGQQHNVLAKVTAYNRQLGDCAEVDLLCRIHPCESFTVSPENGFLPLSRSVIVAPYKSVLDVKICMELCSHKINRDDEEFFNIIKTGAVFRACLPGKYHYITHNRHGVFKVEIICVHK